MANVRKLAVVVPLATTDVILDIDVENFTEGGFAITNAGSNAFDAFEVRAIQHPSGPEITIAASAADYAASIAFPLRRVIGAPVTLAAAATATIWMSLDGIKRLRFYASAAVGASTANINGQMK